VVETHPNTCAASDLGNGMVYVILTSDGTLHLHMTYQSNPARGQTGPSQTDFKSKGPGEVADRRLSQT